MQIEPIENRPIPGVTFRGLVWVAGGAASFAIFIVISYYSILTKLNDSANTINLVQKDLKEIKEDRRNVDNTINAKIFKLEAQFYDIQIRQVRYELVLKEKGIMRLD